MDPWHWALLAVASLVAVITLVRLMLRRRDELIGQLGDEIAREKRRQRRTPQDKNVA